MSDLAPFVAATIRDRVVQELMEENKLLRKHLEKERNNRIMVQIGDRFNVYCETPLTNGYQDNFYDWMNHDRGKEWVVDFESQRDANGNKIKVPWWAFFSTLRINLGGFDIEAFESDNETIDGQTTEGNSTCYFFDGHDDNGRVLQITAGTEGKSFSFFFKNSHVLQITAEPDERSENNDIPEFFLAPLAGVKTLPDVNIQKVVFEERYIWNVLKQYLPN